MLYKDKEGRQTARLLLFPPLTEQINFVDEIKADRVGFSYMTNPSEAHSFGGIFSPIYYSAAFFQKQGLQKPCLHHNFCNQRTVSLFDE